MAGRAKGTEEDRVPAPGAYKLNRDDKWSPATPPLHFDKNVAGYGPGDAFIRAYLAEHPGESVGVIPCAVGGSSIKAWGNGAKHLENAVRRLKAALPYGELAGVLWHQGETDALKMKEGRYKGLFDEMVRRVRREAGREVPVVVGEIGRFMEAESARINPIIASCAAATPNCACVSSEGLKNQDKFHFDRASAEELGRRYYAAWKTLSPGLAVPPSETAAKLSELFLSTSPDLYKPEGYRGGKPYGGGEVVHYSVVSLWVNALECAQMAGDTNLVRRLADAFEPAYGEKKVWMNAYRHVDLSIVGAIPLEIAILTGDKRAKELGLMYADRQWEEPREELDWGERWYDAIPLADRHANWEKGYSPETRMWIDDMYMITFLQSQAYRLTQDSRYIERAGKEMCMYLKRLQRPDGLFDHAPGAPFAWGRGNGWMAAAMALNLRHLPPDSEWRAPILEGYRRMMSALLRWQRTNGLWGQLVNDPESYNETSATAMFAYAFAEGAKSGVLGPEYRVAAEGAYNALVSRLDEHGNIPDVCVGTGWKNDRNHYLTRPRCVGDPHGQAPLLWLCGALMRCK